MSTKAYIYINGVTQTELTIVGVQIPRTLADSLYEKLVGIFPAPENEITLTTRDLTDTP
jgi:hypothetical protein